MNKDILEKIKKISALALELSNDTDKQEHDVKLPVAMVDFSGHVGMVSVRFYENGWHTDADHSYNCCTYFKDAKTLDKIIAEMERMAEIRYKLENPEVEDEN